MTNEPNQMTVRLQHVYKDEPALSAVCTSRPVFEDWEFEVDNIESISLTLNYTEFDGTRTKAYPFDRPQLRIDFKRQVTIFTEREYESKSLLKVMSYK